MGSANSHQLVPKGKSLAILYVGIDLAENVHYRERVLRNLTEPARKLGMQMIPVTQPA